MSSQHYLSQPWPKDPVARRLGSIRRRERLYHVLAVLLCCACAGFAYLLAIMSADRAWELVGQVRWTSLQIALTVLAVGGGGAALWVLFRPADFGRRKRRVLLSRG